MTHKNHHDGGRILATGDTDLEMVGLGWWLVANHVLWCMENGDETLKHLGMAAVKKGNHFHTADNIDWCVSKIDYVCQ